MANHRMLLKICWYLQYFIALAQGQHTSEVSLTDFTALGSPESSGVHDPLPSSLSSSIYSTPAQEIVLSGTLYQEALNTAVTSLSPLDGTVTHSPTPTLTRLNGTLATTSARPTNTQPCNLYLEFCGQSYGNITYVGAHNSPFIRENSAAANQQLDVITQLNDGIRMRMYFPEIVADLQLIFSSRTLTQLLAAVQGQTHMVDGVLYFCHTRWDKSLLTIPCRKERCSSHFSVGEVAIFSMQEKWRTG